MRMRFKPYARPELLACDFHVHEPLTHGGHWHELYARPDQPWHLELGCGKGGFLAQIAPAHPDINYLGIDITDKVLILAKRKVEAAYAAHGIPADNVKIASLDIERLGNAFTPEDRVSRIYINFCNPWSKNAGSNKHRLTHPRQLLQYRQLMDEGAEIWFKTDDDDLFRDSLSYFPAAGFEITWQTFDLHKNEPDWNLRTEHEGMFSEQGIPIKALIARKGPDSTVTWVEPKMTPTEFAVKTLYWFFLYGFIGWGVEVVYAAIKTHKLVNRGFLCGPICPIYGFGMVGLIYSVSLIPMPDSGSMSAVAIFFIGMILTTAIELVGGWALFKIYHIRWWDYSNMKFNLGGYICPQFSLLWGLGSVLMIKVVHPLLARGSSPMPFNIMLIVDVVLLVLFVVDVAASTAAAIGLNKYLREIDELRAKLRVTSDKLTTVLGTGAMTADTILDEQKLQLALAKLEGRENADVLRAELTIRAAALREKLTAAEHDHLGTRRLLRAFPDMKSLNYADTLAATRAAMLRLRELAAAAKNAARETAANAKEKIKKA